MNLSRKFLYFSSQMLRKTVVVSFLVDREQKKNDIWIKYEHVSNSLPWPKAATSIFKHHLSQNIPTVKQQPPLLPRIHYLIICNVVEAQDLPPHKQPSFISHRIRFVIWKYLRCEGTPACIRKCPLLWARYTSYTRNHLVNRTLPTTRFNVLYK